MVARIQNSVFAVFKKQPEAADDRCGEAGNHEAVPGIFQIEQREVAGERLLDLARHRTELPQRVVLQDQRNAERCENCRERIAADKRPQRHDLDRCSNQRHNQRCNQQRQPEIARRRQHQDADISAQHEQFAVREIDDIHDAENQCEA